MKVLELFAGSRSFGKVAEEFGWEVFSTDNHPYDNINLVDDIMNVNPSDIPFVPDVIWASPPCTTYSIAGIRFHRREGKAFSENAKMADKIVQKTIDLINHFLELNPNLTYYIENPRGTLRKQDFMFDLPRATVWYCQYGDNRAKPTDLWSNNLYDLTNPTGWIPRPECHNGNENCHHDKQPRSYKSRKAEGIVAQGTQGQANNHERSKVPYELCKEIIESYQ